MTRKLLIIIALGATLAIIAAGKAISGTVGVGNVTVTAPGTEQVLPQCSNLADDDGDGLTDLADPGCSGPTDGSEYNAPTSGGSGGSGGIAGTGIGGSGGSGSDNTSTT